MKRLFVTTVIVVLATSPVHAAGGTAGCAPVVREALSTGAKVGYQTALTITRSERRPPGKVLNSCVGAMIQALRAINIFSGSFSAAAIVETVIEQAEKMVCGVLTDAFNEAISKPFNAVAFITEQIPCGVDISLPSAGGGGGGLNFCGVIGGPVISIGTSPSGSHTPVLGSSVPAPAPAPASSTSRSSAPSSTNSGSSILKGILGQ